MLTNKTIYLDLLGLAENYPDTAPNEVQKVYQNGSFKLRCIPTRQAIINMALKYKRQRSFTSPKQRRT